MADTITAQIHQQADQQAEVSVAAADVAVVDGEGSDEGLVIPVIPEPDYDSDAVSSFLFDLRAILTQCQRIQ